MKDKKMKAGCCYGDLDEEDLNSEMEKFAMALYEQNSFGEAQSFLQKSMELLSTKYKVDMVVKALSAVWAQTVAAVEFADDPKGVDEITDRAVQEFKILGIKAEIKVEHLKERIPDE